MALAKVLASALRWPTFLFTIFCLYWSVTILSINHKLQWLNLRKKRNDVLGWAQGMKGILNFTVLKVGDQELYRDKCMYLCNHRSWADFMVDQYVTEGRSLFLSRWAVMFVFPQFMFAIRAMRAVILFKRGKINDKDGFNRRIDEEFEASPQTALAVYPEGHRSTHGQSLPLKRGMLHYAYSRKLPSQIVIGANKEAILSEKHCTARFHQTVAVGYSEVIRPADYATSEEFIAKVQTTWDATWNNVFGAEWKGLPMLPEARPQFDYPFHMRLRMLFISPANIVLGVVAGAYFFTWARGMCALLGAWEVPALALFFAYIAAAFYVNSQPVDALTLHQSMMRQQKHLDAAAPAAAGADGKKAA